MDHKVVCTAGHIDHGKTALIKALTGMNTDRLTEEKIRGITIDLGFGFYGEEVTIIDLPGHERFIRNMVAGAATVDYALMVVAADDGPMPQTLEHLQILNLLGIRRGMIVISKIDLAEDDWIELLEEDLREKVADTFLRDAPIIPLDSLSGRGFEDFRRLFEDEIASLPSRLSRDEFRLPVDRSFTIKGFGTVVTGTVISGEIKLKDIVELLPSGKQVKVRGIQVHGKDCADAQTGFRTALNLTGVEKSEITRGDILAQPGFLISSDRFDCRIRLLKSAEPLKHRQRLRFHLGTAEIIGRILLLDRNLLEPGGTAFAQLELEQPTAALRADHFVFRTYSPQTTIGGGRIITAAAEKHKRRQKPLLDLLQAIDSGEPEVMISAILKNAGWEGKSGSQLLRISGLTITEFQKVVESLSAEGKITPTKFGGENCFALPGSLETLETEIRGIVKQFHRENPTQRGMSLAQIKSALKTGDSPFIERTLEKMAESGGILKAGSAFALPDHTITLNPRQQKLSEEILRILAESGLSAPKAHPLADQLKVEVEAVKDILAILESMNQIIRLEAETALYKPVFLEALEKLRELEATEGGIFVSEAVKKLECGRRVTVALLEYLDRAGITQRDGDVRRFK